MNSSKIVESLILAASAQLKCTQCGDIEYVMPLDDGSIIDLSEQYICSDCEAG